MDPKTRAALEALLADEGSAATEAAPASGPQPDANGDYPVRLVLAVEGHETSDRRLIAPGALQTRAFPQSIAAQTQPGHGGEPGPSIICGRLDSAERVPGPEVRSRETGEPFPEGTFVWRGTGVLFGEKGKPAQHGSPLDLVLKGGLTGNSVDLNNVEVELTFDTPTEPAPSPDGGMGLPGEDNGDGTRTIKHERPPLQTFTKAMLGMTTLVPVPAFAEAYVEIGTADGWEVITPATELGDVEGAPFITVDLPADEEQGAVVASGAGGDPLPPAWWFDEPKDRTQHLDHTVPLQIEEPDPAHGGLRRVWGYVLDWQACHTGFTDRCVAPPHSPSGYAAYHVGTTMAMAEDGGPVRVATGPLTIGAGHASTAPGVSRAAAVAHYDDVCTQAGRLRCGEDALGVWAAGYLWPETTDADVRILRAAPPSGDWRAEFRQPHDMIAVHCVNVPGYRHKTAYRIEDGAVAALVAAGAIAPDEAPPTPSGAVVLDYDQLADALGKRLGLPVTRPDYEGEAAALEADDGGSSKVCNQKGCGKPATKTVLTKGDAGPLFACDEHSDAVKQKAGPDAVVKGLADLDADALDLRRRRAATLAGVAVPPREDVEPLEDGLDELCAGLALWAYRDHLTGADLDDLDEDDRACLAEEALKKKGNWVTQVGGLPKFIKRVAKHLQEKGMTESHAIATAVNVVKKYCAKGDLNFPGKQNVTAKTKATGCAAVADWERKKAQARAT